MSLLSAHELTLAHGPRTVLGRLSLTFSPGEMVTVMGANGAGKSTLLKAFAGILPPTAGEVRIDDKPLASYAPGERARMIGYMGQNTRAEHPLPVEEVVALGRIPHLGPLSRIGEADKTAIHDALSEADLLHVKDRDATHLSGGEAVRMMLARALSTKPRILLVDEPVSGLDPAHALEVMELLMRKATQGTLVVSILHDLSLAARFASRVVLLHEKRILAAGTPGEVLAQKNLIESLNINALYGKHEAKDYIVPWSVDKPRQ